MACLVKKVIDSLILRHWKVDINKGSNHLLLIICRKFKICQNLIHTGANDSFYHIHEILNNKKLCDFSTPPSKPTNQVTSTNTTNTASHPGPSSKFGMKEKNCIEIFVPFILNPLLHWLDF